MVKIYDVENILVFEKKIAKTSNRYFVEIPAKLRHKVKRDVKYLVILVPVKRLLEEEF